MFWIAVAAQISSPQPIDFLSWFSPDDMPAYVQRKGGVWRVSVRMVVGPDGKLVDCEIDHTSGDSALDTFTCELIRQRGKFKPARWTDGSAAYGTYKSPVTWAVVDGKPSGSMLRAEPMDLEIAVDRLPDKVRSPTVVWMMFAADAEGKPLSCSGEPRPLSKINPQLVEIACAQLIKSYKARQVRDQSGQPVPSVQDAGARFTKQ